MDMEPVIPAYQVFAEEMGPILWSEIIRQGVKNPSQAYKNMIMQLGYESKYGTTRLAKEQNNYGGVGYNDTTKTYNSYKDKKHFARDYVRLMNSRYKNAVQAKTLSDYAKQIRDLGYYTDTLENYSRNLNGMKSFQRAVYNHMQANPDMYQGGISMVKTSDGNKKLVIDPAVYGLEKPGFESTWKPEQSIKKIYHLNDTTPKSISSWSGADAPNATPRLKDFQEVRQEDLNRGVDVYGDPVSPFSLRLRLPSLTSLLQLNSPEEQAKQHFADALGISDMLPQTPSLFPKLKDGKVPNDPYERFKYSLPDNQKNTPESEYNTRRYWELNGRPKSFSEAVERGMYDLQEDGWHANSVAENKETGEYEFMKPRTHPTVNKELEWYYSDEGKEFRKKYKHIQPKDSQFDKYVPRLKNGKLPKFGDGKRYIPDFDGTGWNRITDDELADVFADLVITPSKNKYEKVVNRPGLYDLMLRNRINQQGYVTDQILEDDNRVRFLNYLSGKGELPLQQVSPEFDLLLLGNGFRSNPLTQKLWKTRTLSKEMNKVFDEGLVGATKDMPVLKPLDMYNPEHMLATVKYNPKQLTSMATADDAATSKAKELAVRKQLEVPTQPARPSFEGVPEFDYNGPIPQTSIRIGSTDRPRLRIPQAAIADPYSDLTTASAGQEMASPELASTLYPRNKYTIQDVPSKLVTRYTEMPNPRTGDSAESVVNSLYNTYVKALEGYGKYGLKPATPYIPSVGDDFVDVGFENQFYDMAHIPSAVEGIKDMPKGITEKTGVKMLQGLPHAQYEFIRRLPPDALKNNSLLRNAGLKLTNRGLRPIGEPIPEQLLPPWGGTNTDIDDPFGLFSLPIETESPFPPQMDIDEFDKYMEVYESFKDREKFRNNLNWLGSKLLSPRYSKILSHAEDPDKYITDNFGKQILRNARENYFSAIKKLKQKDYARRVKKAEQLNQNDTRFEIADDNRDRLQDVIAPGKSFNTSIKDAQELQNVIGTLGNWTQDASKDWIQMQTDPNRPGWMLKSLMQGNPLEKQLSKDGTISVTNIQNHIKKGSDIEKYVVDKVLNDKFAGQSKISYRDFKHAVQNELISYRHEPNSGYEDYGMDRIKWHRSWDNNLKLDTYTFSSDRIPHGNPKHYNENTLGHSRTFTDPYNDPDTMYVLESQSDWGQGELNTTDKNHAKYLHANWESRQIQENLLHAARKGQTKMRYPTSDTAAKIEDYPSDIVYNYGENQQLFEQLVDKIMRKNKYSRINNNFDNVARSLSRAMDENPLTSNETMLNNFNGGIEYDDDILTMMDKIRSGEVNKKRVYTSSHTTILRKYDEFPKKFKKLYRDQEVRIVTDSKGNTWYEVDVPKDLKRREWMYGIGATLTAGATTLKPRKNK